MQAAEPVLLDRPRPHVRRLTLNRPEVLNAITGDLIEALHDEVRDAERDSGCRVLVLTGAGRGFCAGLDLKGYGLPPGAQDRGTVHTNLAIQQHVAGLVQRLHRLRKPVVAQVNGPAAGFGLALTCVADLRVASTETVFTTAFVQIGATGCDLGVSWLLPRLVGAGRAHELMLTARRFDAEEALRIGLLADAVPPDRLEARVDVLVDQLLAVSPLALELTKEGMWLGLAAGSLVQAMELENRQQILVGATADRDEGLAAFLERRAAHFEFR